MSREWYRRRVWSSEDAKEFESKLLRAHSRNRAQYLRIQAYHLAEASLHAAKGNLPLASRHAKNALAAMDAKESGFRYHRNLGLVRDVEHTIIKRLIDLAAN